MPYLDINGTKTHYKEFNRGASDTILMVHPFMSSMSHYLLSFSPAMEKDFHVILFDWKAHGQSDAPQTGYHVETLADDMAALLEQLSVKEAHLVSFSFSSILILKFALMYPHMTKALGIIEGARKPNFLEKFSPVIAQKGTDVTQVPREVFPADIRAYFFGNETKMPRTKKKMLKAWVEQTNILAELDEVVWVEGEALKAIPQPIALVYGDQSEFLDVAEDIRDNAPNATIYTTKGTHNLILEEPAFIAETLNSFFAKNTSYAYNSASSV